MEETTVQVRLSIDAAEQVDAEEVAELGRRLRAELLELDVEQAEFASTPAPEGAKSAGEAVTWGVLMVTALGSGGVLTQIVDAVRSWASRHERCSVTLELGDAKLQVDGVSPELRRELVDAWLQSAARG